MASAELLGRPLLQGSASTAGSRERGLCFASLGPGRQGRSSSRRTVRSKPPVGALAERVVLAPTPAERVARPEAHPQSVAARAVVTVRRKRKVEVKEQVAEQMDAYADRVGRSVLLELISTETDQRKGGPKKSKKSRLVGWFEKRDVKAELVVYTAEFTVDADFGDPGAVTVLNRHQREFFIESILVEGFPSGPAHFTCNSWVQPTRVDSTPRVFFTNKPYLPSQTPPGLRELRRRELKELRGSGTGERKITDRAYDYDVYNDLGNPDKGPGFERPVLGGDRLPYPRRMRTARPSTVTGKRRFPFVHHLLLLLLG